jgi:hypothetical protein
MVAFRVLIVAACAAVVVACSSNPLEHTVQQPGEPATGGLQVPPDAWSRPAAQTASLPAR